MIQYLNMNRILKFKQTEEQKVYWISDTHFNHNPKWKVPLWEQRGFKSSEEHTDGVINKINEIVRPNDILFHLGDFCLNTSESQFEELLSRINCQHIHYIWGNHNSRIDQAYKKSVTDYLRSIYGDGHYNHSEEIEIYPTRYRNLIFIGNYAEVVVDGRYFILSHYPIQVVNHMKDGAIHLTGHSHYNLPFSQADNLDAKILDVGFDGFGKPLSTEEVLKIMNTKKIFQSGDHHTNVI